jgi:Glu/Leu/Phe/Val dehydrogenase, dimerisation domain
MQAIRAVMIKGMTGRNGGGPEIVELGTVPGVVVFDLPGAPLSAGGTRLAPDVSVAEVAVLARSMTYKFAALGQRIGGAKAGLRGDPADQASRAALMARFCAEIRPLTDAGHFLTGPDMGTAEEDFAPLRERRAAPAAIRAVVAGVPFEDLLTGYGVAVAAETALQRGPDGTQGPKGWDGHSVAIEGFGKVGGGVAGAVIGYRSAADATPDQVLAAVEARIAGLIDAALGHPGGPLAGACEQAGGFRRSWWGEPPGVRARPGPTPPVPAATAAG